MVILLNNKKLGIPAMILACLIAFSRLYLYVHYPTDVIFSIILGTAFAFLGNYLAHKVFEKFPRKITKRTANAVRFSLYWNHNPFPRNSMI